MRSDLISGLPAHVAAGGPVKLPGENPDIDLTLEDHRSSTLVLAESSGYESLCRCLSGLTGTRSFSRG